MADPVREIKDTVGAHTDAVFGTAGRAVLKAADLGGEILDAGSRGVRAVRRYFAGEPRKRTTDIRLPTPPRRQTRRR